jgi:1-deoxy-D-xylulose-5-phosphate reductoisomerase
MNILVFGATGSIGKQTIDVIHKLKFSLVGISFYHNEKVAAKIKTKYKFSPINSAKSNVKSYEDLIVKSKPDMIVNAIVGFAGLEITLLAIKHKIDIALANKESLVSAGRFIIPMAKKNKINIYPIDSEHASLQQILKQVKKPFKQLYITASGGPFYHYSSQQLAKVSYKETIKHPT